MSITAEIRFIEDLGLLPVFRSAALTHGVRASLLMAVASRESRMGRIIQGDWVGDSGHGRGIMQIDDRHHSAFVASHANDDHAANVRKGAEVLAYGYDEFPHDDRAALASYNASSTSIRRVMRQGRDPEAATTGGNYVSDVLMRELVINEELQRLGLSPRAAVPLPGPLAAVGPVVDLAAGAPVVVSLLGGAGIAALLNRKS